MYFFRCSRIQQGIAVCCCLLLLQVTAGQTAPTGSDYIIRFDSLKRPDKAIPFDRAFTIVVTPKNPQAVSKIIGYPISSDSKGNWQKSTTSAFLQVEPPRVQGSTVAFDVPALPPNYHFDFALIRKLDGDLLDEMLKYANFVSRYLVGPPVVPPVAADLLKMDQGFFDFRAKLIYNPYGANSGTTFKIDYLLEATCLADGNSDCVTRSLDKVFTPAILTSYRNIFGATVATTTPAGIEADLQQVARLFRSEKWNDALLAGVIRLHAAGATVTQWKQGLVSTAFSYRSTPTSQWDIKGRLANWRRSADDLARLSDSVDRLNYLLGAPTTAITNVDTYLKTLATDFASKADEMKAEVDGISTYFSGYSSLFYEEWFISNTNNILDLKTQSSTLFSPQLGLAYTGVKGPLGGREGIPKLTAGVNINFRPIDRNLERRTIPNKKVFHYLSGYVGISLGKFRDPKYDNLLASNSLLVGLNYRASKSFYISAGAFGYRQRHSNPVINDYHTAVGVYAALLLDVDITAAAASLTTIIFK